MRKSPEEKAKHAAYMRKWYYAHKEKWLAGAKRYREANKEKIAERQKRYYASEKGKKAASDWHKKNYLENRAKRIAYQKNLRETQPELMRQRDREKYLRHKEKIKARVHKYDAANPHIHLKSSAKYRAANKAECDRRTKEWDKRHPEKKRFYAKMYRIARSQATPAWADLDLIADAYQESEYHGLHVDHVIPLRGKTVCGLNVWENLELISKSANSAKGNRHWPDMPTN